MLLHLSDHSPEPLRSQIARQLRSKIVLGDLEPGVLAAVQERTGPTPADDCTAVVVQHLQPAGAGAREAGRPPCC